MLVRAAVLNSAALRCCAGAKQLVVFWLHACAALSSSYQMQMPNVIVSRVWLYKALGHNLLTSWWAVLCCVLQEEAVSAISRAIRRARVGLKNPNRPIASFIFAGPTGVGKSELAKTLASYYFGSEEAMVRMRRSCTLCVNSSRRAGRCSHGVILACVGGTSQC